VLVSVSAATNCRYFFMRVVWSTTVGLGAAATKAMAPAGRDRAAAGGRRADAGSAPEAQEKFIHTAASNTEEDTSRVGG